MKNGALEAIYSGASLLPVSLTRWTMSGGEAERDAGGSFVLSPEFRNGMAFGCKRLNRDQQAGT